MKPLPQPPPSISDGGDTASEVAQSMLSENGTALLMGGGKLREYDEGEVAMLTFPSGVLRVDISGNHLAELPSWVVEMGQLRDLDARGNQFETLPSTFAQLSELQYLSLNENRLGSAGAFLSASLPSAAPSLVFFNLAGNHLELFPERIGAYAALSTLILSNNQLSELPASLKQLRALRMLDLSANRLGLIDTPFSAGAESRNVEVLTSLRSLMQLNLAENPLGGLPEAFRPSSFPQLQLLDVSNTKISQPPPAWAQWARGSKGRIFQLASGLTSADSRSITQLVDMFPNVSPETVRDVYTRRGDFDKAVHDLLERKDGPPALPSQGPPSRPPPRSGLARPPVSGSALLSAEVERNPVFVALRENRALRPLLTKLMSGKYTLLVPQQAFFDSEAGAAALSAIGKDFLDCHVVRMLRGASQVRVEQKLLSLPHFLTLNGLVGYRYEELKSLCLIGSSANPESPDDAAASLVRMRYSTRQPAPFVAESMIELALSAEQKGQISVLLLKYPLRYPNCPWALQAAASSSSVPDRRTLPPGALGETASGGSSLTTAQNTLSSQNPSVSPRNSHSTQGEAASSETSGSSIVPLLDLAGFRQYMTRNGRSLQQYLDNEISRLNSEAPATLDQRKKRMGEILGRAEEKLRHSYAKRQPGDPSSLDYLTACMHADVYARAARVLVDRGRDRSLAARIGSLRFITPAMMGVAANELGCRAAAAELARLPHASSPVEKLKVVLNCAKALMATLHAAGKPGAAVGADDFLPHLILAVVRANPPNLASSLEICGEYAPPEALSGEREYYFIQLHSAVSFLENATAAQLNLSEQEFAALLSASAANPPPSTRKSSKHPSAQHAVDSPDDGSSLYPFLNTAYADLKASEVEALLEAYKSLALRLISLEKQ